jgi:hypothetical protein
VSPFVRVADDAPTQADKELLVAADQAPLPHLLWALEVATGVPVLRLNQFQPPMWRFVPERYPDRANEPYRPDKLLRLPAKGFGGLSQTLAGAKILPSMRTALIPISDVPKLPPVIQYVLATPLSPSQHSKVRPNDDAQALIAEGRSVLLWPPGFHLEAMARTANGGGIGVLDVDLPAF